MDFLERLEKLSKDRGIENNYQLAEQSGVPYTTIDNFYRRGYEKVQLPTLKKLASFFGCTLDYLIYGDEKTRPQLSERVLSIIAKNVELRETVELLASLDSGALESIKSIAREIAKRGQ